MARYCSGLRPNENVVFLYASDRPDRKIPYDGNVIYVDKEAKKVCVCFLEGYKVLSEMIPFSDMLAVYDKNGEMMKFDNISGKSQKLINR